MYKVNKFWDLPVSWRSAVLILLSWWGTKGPHGIMKVNLTADDKRPGYGQRNVSARTIYNFEV